jgi:hypothetical protein
MCIQKSVTRIVNHVNHLVYKILRDAHAKHNQIELLTCADFLVNWKEKKLRAGAR